jgi:hypothetical protein
MTKLLEEAVERLRNLPEGMQDKAAEFLFAYLANRDQENRKPSPSQAKPKSINQ